MKRMFVGRIYLDLYDGTLVEYLGTKYGSKHVKQLNGRFKNVDYWVHKGNEKDYIPVCQIKLLKILYGIL